MRLLRDANSVTFVSVLQKIASFILEQPIDVRASAVGSSTDMKKTISVLMTSDLTEDEKTKSLVRLLHEVGHHEEKTVPFESMNPELLNRMINMVDDIRIEKRQEKKYHGLLELRKWYHPVVYREFNEKDIATVTKADLQKFIYKLSCVLLHTVRFRQLGIDIKIKMSKDIQEAYDKYLRDLEDRAYKQDAPRDSVELGTIIYERIKKLVEDREKDKGEGKSKGKPDPKDKSEGADDPSEKSDDDKDSDKDSEDPDKGKESTGGSEKSDKPKIAGKGDSGESEELDEETKERIERTLEKLDEADMETPEERIDRALAEKAESDGAYLVAPGVVDIIEYNKEQRNYDAILTLEKGKELLGATGTMMTKLFVSNTKPRALHNQYEGRFDARAFMSDVMDVRKDLYTAKIPGRLDKAAVSFVMDNSGSMSGEITFCYQILSAMLYYLSKAGIPTEAVGFTAETSCDSRWRDSPIILSIIKKFEDTYDGHVQARSVRPNHMKQNAEVDALRWAVPHLLARPEPKKVLMVLGDGDPCIGNDSLNYKLSRAYKKYISDCKALGIYCIGFGLGCDLSQFYGEDYVSCDASDVGQKMLEKLTQVLNRGRR